MHERLLPQSTTIQASNFTEMGLGGFQDVCPTIFFFLAKVGSWGV